MILQVVDFKRQDKPDAKDSAISAVCVLSDGKYKIKTMIQKRFLSQMVQMPEKNDIVQITKMKHLEKDDKLLLIATDPIIVLSKDVKKLIS